MKAQLAGREDPIADATKPWPANRPTIVFGTLTAERAVPDSLAAERTLLFLPGAVIDGIEPSDDPLIQARDDAYAVSFSRRSQ